jgi:hypothetical protein
VMPEGSTQIIPKLTTGHKLNPFLYTRTSKPHNLFLCDHTLHAFFISLIILPRHFPIKILCRILVSLYNLPLFPFIFIHSFYLASIIAMTGTVEQVTSFNSSFSKSFCPKGLKDWNLSTISNHCWHSLKPTIKCNTHYQNLINDPVI